MTAVKPPSDPRLRAFAEALAEALAQQLAAELTAGRVAALPDDDEPPGRRWSPCRGRDPGSTLTQNSVAAAPAPKVSGRDEEKTEHVNRNPSGD